VEFVNGVSASSRILLVRPRNSADSQTTTSRILHLSKSPAVSGFGNPSAAADWFRVTRRRNRLSRWHLSGGPGRPADRCERLTPLARTFFRSPEFPASHHVRGERWNYSAGLTACRLLEAAGQQKTPQFQRFLAGTLHYNWPSCSCQPQVLIF
jgi:hypothetical protein